MKLIAENLERIKQDKRYAIDFREISQIGKGGFAQVLKVQNTIDNHIYAVKKIKLKVKGIENKLEKELTKVLQEARNLAKMNHPNIIRYYNSWLEVNERKVEERKNSQRFMGNGRVRQESQDSSFDKNIDSYKNSNFFMEGLDMCNEDDPFEFVHEGSEENQGDSNIEEENEEDEEEDSEDKKNQKLKSLKGKINKKQQNLLSEEKGKLNAKNQNSSKKQKNGSLNNILGVQKNGGSSFILQQQNNSKNSKRENNISTTISNNDNLQNNNVLIENSSSNTSNNDGDSNNNNQKKNSNNNNNNNNNKSQNLLNRGRLFNQKNENGVKISTSCEGKYQKQQKKNDNADRKKSIEESPGKELVGKFDSIFFYIQTELCKETLDDYITKRNKHCSPNDNGVLVKKYQKEAFSILEQTIQGLEHIHQDWLLVHRDLKPHNIFLTENMCVKIGDFGLVKRLNNFMHLQPHNQMFKKTSADLYEIEKHKKKTLKLEKEASKIKKQKKKGKEGNNNKSIYLDWPDHNDDQEFTKNCGTATYASPEQSEGDIQCDFRADIYSLGVIILQLLHICPTLMELSLLIQNCKKGILPNNFSPKKMGIIVLKCLDRDPKKRPSLGEIKDVVKQCEVEQQQQEESMQILSKSDISENYEPKNIQIANKNLYLIKINKKKAQCVYNLKDCKIKLVEEIIIQSNAQITDSHSSSPINQQSDQLQQQQNQFLEERSNLSKSTNQIISEVSNINNNNNIGKCNNNNNRKDSGNSTDSYNFKNYKMEMADSDSNTQKTPEPNLQEKMEDPNFLNDSPIGKLLTKKRNDSQYFDDEDMGNINDLDPMLNAPELLSQEDLKQQQAQRIKSAHHLINNGCKNAITSERENGNQQFKIKDYNDINNNNDSKNEDEEEEKEDDLSLNKRSTSEKFSLEIDKDVDMESKQKFANKYQIFNQALLNNNGSAHSESQAQIHSYSYKSYTNSQLEKKAKSKDYSNCNSSIRRNHLYKNFSKLSNDSSQQKQKQQQQLQNKQQNMPASENQESCASVQKAVKIAKTSSEQHENVANRQSKEIQQFYSPLQSQISCQPQQMNEEKNTKDLIILIKHKLLEDCIIKAEDNQQTTEVYKKMMQELAHPTKVH